MNNNRTKETGKSAAAGTNNPNEFLTGFSFMFFLKSLISLLIFSLRPLSS